MVTQISRLWYVCMMGTQQSRLWYSRAFSKTWRSQWRTAITKTMETWTTLKILMKNRWESFCSCRSVTSFSFNIVEECEIMWSFIILFNLFTDSMISGADRAWRPWCVSSPAWKSRVGPGGSGQGTPWHHRSGSTLCSWVPLPIWHSEFRAFWSSPTTSCGRNASTSSQGTSSPS